MTSDDQKSQAQAELRHPPRPHAVPCFCETCVRWAKNIAAAPSVRR
jgi:hypothetical protein